MKGVIQCALVAVIGVYVVSTAEVKSVETTGHTDAPVKSYRVTETPVAAASSINQTLFPAPLTDVFRQSKTLADKMKMLLLVRKLERRLEREERRLEDKLKRVLNRLVEIKLMMDLRKGSQEKNPLDGDAEPLQSYPPTFREFNQSLARLMATAGNETADGPEVRVHQTIISELDGRVQLSSNYTSHNRTGSNPGLYRKRRLSNVDDAYLNPRRLSRTAALKDKFFIDEDAIDIPPEELLNQDDEPIVKEELLLTKRSYPLYGDADAIANELPAQGELEHLVVIDPNQDTQQDLQVRNKPAYGRNIDAEVRNYERDGFPDYQGRAVVRVKRNRR